MYKVCDSCGELFLPQEEHKYVEGFGYVCFLCIEEGFQSPTSEDSKEAKRYEAKEQILGKFPKINLNS